MTMTVEEEEEALLLAEAVAVAASSEKCGLEGRKVSHRITANDNSDTTVDDAAISAFFLHLRLPPCWWCFLEQSLGDSC
jgi:hypothetical protein